MQFAKGSFTITPTPAEKPVKGKKRTVWVAFKTAAGQLADGVSHWIGGRS